MPTSQALVDKMLDMAKVTPQDFVMDLGSGDGRTVITAAKRGARAMGIEYNPEMVELSKRNAAAAGLSEDKAKFMKADLFETDFIQATVITMFLLPSINLKLRPKILDMKPGTRVVSNTFTMEDWEPDETANIQGDCTSWCTALFWIVPAKVEGTWQMPAGNLALTQQFQKMSGTLGSSRDRRRQAARRRDQLQRRKRPLHRARERHVDEGKRDRRKRYGLDRDTPLSNTFMHRSTLSSHSLS